MANPGATRRRSEELHDPCAVSIEGAPDRIPEPGGSQLRILRRFVGTVLVVYWATLFIATHLPIPEGPMRIPGADKAVHFTGYGILGLLLACWIALRRRLTAGGGVAVVLALAGYGAIDEWLQIPVGRSCDLADWLCDVLGSSVGVLVIALLSRLQPPVRPADGDADARDDGRQ